MGFRREGSPERLRAPLRRRCRYPSWTGRRRGPAADDDLSCPDEGEPAGVGAGGGAPEDGASGTAAARSAWSRAVRLHNEVRAWMLAHCGEPDLADRNPLRDLAERRAAQETDAAAS